MKYIKFKIVTENGNESLEASVERELNNGWKLTGPLSMAMSGRFAYERRMAQSMTKEIEVEEENRG